MKTFFFKVQQSSDKRGYNRTIYVYRIKNNQPEFLGYDEEIHTASYKGDRGVAAKIIHEVTGAKWLKGREGYELASKQIQIFEI
jgi:hypothetical protein